MSKETPPSDRIDPYLTRKAQKRIYPAALVIERPDGSWVLRIDEQDIYALGHSFGEARQALLNITKPEGRLFCPVTRQRLGYFIKAGPSVTIVHVECPHCGVMHTFSTEIDPD